MILLLGLYIGYFFCKMINLLMKFRLSRQVDRHIEQNTMIPSSGMSARGLQLLLY